MCTRKGDWTLFKVWMVSLATVVIASMSSADLPQPCPDNLQLSRPPPLCTAWPSLHACYLPTVHTILMRTLQVKQKGGTVEQIVIADMAFDVLKSAWAKFESGELRK